MNNILFAFQHWNEEYQWWHPNNTPLDFVYNGEKKLPLTHDFLWFEFSDNLEKQGNLNAFSYTVHKNETLFNYKDIKFCLLDDIQEQNYIYPIFIRTATYFRFNNEFGFKFIDPKVITDVKQGRAKIVLIHCLEGFSNKRDWEILNSWCIREGLTKGQVYFIHGNFNHPKISGYNFTYLPVHSFVCSFPLESPSNGFNPVDNKNLFLSYNRRSNLHRAVTVTELVKYNLIDRGMVSYLGDYEALGAVSTADYLEKRNRHDLIESAKKLDKMGTLKLDRDISRGATNPAYIVKADHYSQSFLSLVTETLAGDPAHYYIRPGENSIFFTEKTWKPISMKHPFMIVASPGFLQELRNQGYQTFSRWWNEDYDKEFDLYKRIQMIMNNLSKLSTLSMGELHSMRQEMESVLDHNLKLLTDTRDIYTNNPLESVYIEIRKIWENF
jgi:hypothetical protein